MEAVDPWNDMVQSLESWGIAMPPVPLSLRPRLLAPRPGSCWATRPITGYAMYDWQMTEAEAVLAGRAADYVALSHAGHGINSYAITYHLVYRGLALFVQEGWGGVYMNRETQRASVTEMFQHCHDLVDQWDADEHDRRSPRRLLCLESRMRGTSACGWVPADGVAVPADAWEDRPTIVMADGQGVEGRPGWDSPLQRFLREHGSGAGEALTHAKRLLESDTGRT